MKNIELFNYHMTLEKLFDMLKEFSSQVRLDVSVETESKSAPEKTTLKLISGYNVAQKFHGNFEPSEDVLAEFSTTEPVNVDVEKIIMDIATAEPVPTDIQTEEDIEKAIEHAIDSTIIEAYYNALKGEIVGTELVKNQELRGMINACYELDMYSSSNGTVQVGEVTKTSKTGLEEFVQYLQEKDLFDHPPEGSERVNS